MNDWMRGFFRGSDCWIVGRGPSLEGFDYGILKGKKTIAINDAYRWMPEAPSIHMFADNAFLLEEEREHGFNHKTCGWIILAGPVVGVHQSSTVFKYQTSGTVSNDPGSLFQPPQFVTGMAAVNAAIIGEADRIILLGFDCRFSDNGRNHAHGPHKNDGDEKIERRLRTIIADAFQIFKSCRNIYHLDNPGTAVDFPQLELQVK